MTKMSSQNRLKNIEKYSFEGVSWFYLVLLKAQLFILQGLKKKKAGVGEIPFSPVLCFPWNFSEQAALIH